MSAFLLSVHLVAAILAVGPIAVAASMFPPAARAAAAADDPLGAATPRLLYRITKVYTVIGVAVPCFGLATAVSLRVLGSAWLLASIALTAAAAAVLIALILPAQRVLLDAIDPASVGAATTRLLARRLAMRTGVFNLLWVVVVVLMVLRPGSTTGVGL
ncbi:MULTISPECIES: hypothetical protein [unclassified Mycobacterium]|uniref:hypothetical protein n=1 Tax=unclassified Mycobacterium TaxID=2642494 RepID=UPI000802126A|nr:MULTISPECIES: hypothetical protein [unclassified Mycobacterium]OBG70903.1 hypothetical protein A5700_13515 [Mycobacterium sp. E1214]OBH29756.1 hypothetical protein A5693_19390 [Mycobacterium sp. E1319]